MSGRAEIKSMRFEIIEGIPEDHQLTTLLSLYQQIFEDAEPDFFINRIKSEKQLVSIIAYYDQLAIAFKIGYRYDESTFYSWVGGVLEPYRNKGVATKLAMLQEKWVKNNGFSKIRTKSMNQYKPMMILNLKNGFDIQKVYTNDRGQTKIVFEKSL